MTPAVAMPMTISGSYSRATLSARPRESSPKSGHSTSNTPFECSTAVRRGDMAATYPVARTPGHRYLLAAYRPCLEPAPTAAHHVQAHTGPHRDMSWWSRLLGG